jgi:predicted TIM-barrel fold metal-dependent hydrolase
VSTCIDCDVHPAVPGMAVLLPYLDDYWREIVALRALDRLNLSLTSYPQNAPINCRPDWRPRAGPPGGSLADLRKHVLEPFGTRIALLNCLYGGQVVHSEDLGTALCRATNDWIRHEWLDRDPRLRASIVIPAQNPEAAVEEIERCAVDRRFVQVGMLLMGEMTLGRRYYWPIYRTAARLGIPVGVHAGGAYRFAPTAIGWPSYYLEDYVAQSAGFEGQLQSLMSEGVFAKFPDLKVVFIESGLSWLPGFIWRSDKTWRGVRAEIPWVTELPSEILKRHLRFTLQPIDAPDEAAELERLVEILGSDELFLFSTDYPHWRFDGSDALPPGLDGALSRKILLDNPLATYPRLELARTDMETLR